MATAMCLDYCYGDELKIDSFCRLPRIFFKSEACGNVPPEAQYLYALMLDRVSLSMRNGWRDADGRVFIYFTLNDVKRLLNVGKNKAVKLFKQLESLDLIHRRKQGQGKPARVFVRTFVEASEENAEGAAPDCGEAPTPKMAPEPQAEAVMEAPPFGEGAPVPEPTPEALPVPVHEATRPAAPMEEHAVMPDAPQSGIAGLLADCAVGVRRLGDILAQRLANGGGIPATGNGVGGAANAAAPVVRTETTGKPIIEGYVRDLTYEGDRWRNAALIRREIHENVDFPILRSRHPADIEQLYGYTEIMVDACCGQTPTVRINGSEYSRAMVRRRMYTLDSSHLEYVLDCMKECAPKVRNIRAYLLTALFNSCDTIDLYYDAKVSHDMARGYEDDDD
ncbi:MAG: replication initiator protein A [Oscillibacter sp.]|nr:replication initiator protein A [Oscillibacter sp.]